MSNNTYIQSLIDYINDTKPFRSKLSEVVEEYHFTDVVNAAITDKLVLKEISRPVSKFDYYSNGVPISMQLHPLNLVGDTGWFYGPGQNSAYTVGVSESTELANIPFQYGKKHYTYSSDASIFRQGTLAEEELLENHDFLNVRGSMQFQINQTHNPDGSANPLYTLTDEVNLISDAASQKAGCINFLIALFTYVLNYTQNVSVYSAVNAELHLLLIDLDNNVLPTDFTALQYAFSLISAPDLALIPDFTLTWFNSQLQKSSSGLFTGMYSNEAVKHAASYSFNNYADSVIGISSITVPANTLLEEFSLVAVSPTQFQVYGSDSGFLGSFIAGASFTSAKVSFNTSMVGSPTIGYTVKLTAKNTISIHPDANLETWNIVKINPKNYTRPVVDSDSYGYFTSANGKNTIQFLTETISGMMIFEAQSASTFKIECGSYQSTFSCNTPFNDGVLSFTFVKGSYDYQVGDRFYIEVVNPAPVIRDFGLYFGYDAFGYDGFDANSPAWLKNLNVTNDSRFPAVSSIDVSLSVVPTALSKSYRLVALPDETNPYNILQKDGTTNNKFDITSPDPSISQAVYDAVAFQVNSHVSSTHSPATGTDITLWHVAQFSVQAFENNGWVEKQIANIGDTVSIDGVTLTIPAKPYLATKVFYSQYLTDDVNSLFTETVTNGDMYFFTVDNQPTSIKEWYKSSVNFPHVIIHAKNMGAAIDAKWTITKQSSGFLLAGLYTSGNNAGSQIYAKNLTELSYQDSYLHFTIDAGKIGMQNGDKLEFETHASPFEYAVYGSYSGFTGYAKFNEWFSNGKIGFKLVPPTINLFENNTLITNGISAAGQIGVQGNKVGTYVLKGMGSKWALYLGTQLLGIGVNSIQTTDISVTMPNPTMATVIIQILSPFDFPFGHNSSIVINKLPQTGNVVNLKKTSFDYMQLAFSAPITAVTPLIPESIDLRFIDQVLVSDLTKYNVTSPELYLNRNFIPLDVKRPTYANNQVSTEINALTGERIGNINSNGLFSWDTSFHDSYLPVNTQISFLYGNTGTNEMVKVNMTERIHFFVDAGNLITDSFKEETVSVTMVESVVTKVKSTYDDAFSGIVLDGDFNGFLPGYSNLPYDAELLSGVGYYDYGYALSENFQKAKELLAKPSLTQDEEQLLRALEGAVGAFVNGTVANTTFAQFVTNLDIMLPASQTPNFGIPALGVAMDLQDNPAETSATGINEALVLVDGTVGIIYLSSKNVTGNPLGIAYAAIDSNIVMPIGVTSVEINFTQDIASPVFYKCEVGGVVSILVATQLNSRKYSLSGVGSNCKLFVG
jgi:hypothetical protein